MEREAIVEAAVALGTVAVFVAALVFVGVQYGDGGLSTQGGRALLGVVVLFIFLMGGAGYWLSRRSA